MNRMPEPKSKTRLLLISLTGVVALLLTLVIILLIVTVTKSAKPPEQEETKQVLLPADDSQPEDTPEEPDQPTETPEPAPKDNPELEPEPEAKNQLLFVKNGDGTCRLVGLGSCTDVCVIIPETSPEGDIVTEISSDAFFGKSNIAAIQIPSTVQFIGERAFADCKDLLYVSVSEKNRFFCDVDGVLYSKDRKTLLQYPTLAASGSVKIPIEVGEIREMAFYNCPYLAKIYYAGGPDDWEAIKIGQKNYALASAAKQFYADRGGK